MVYCPLSTQPVVWRNTFLVGAEITLYDAGTLTPRTGYGDGLYSSALAQPILSDGNGCIPSIWVQGNAYKVQILTPQGSLVRVVDNLPGDVATGGPSPPPPPAGSGNLTTGDVVWNYGTQIIPGRVRCNGKTIGDTASGGTEFADPSCQNLFTWLWNGDASLVVVGGRGASASADWSANKAITLPDVNGRSIRGIDGMGSLATGRLTGVPFTHANSASLGGAGGEGTHVVAVTEMPSHTHTGTSDPAGSHQHTGTTDANAYYQQNFVTDAQGSHAHGGATGNAGTHTHSASADAQGVHSHGGATGGDSPAHTHGYTFQGPTSASALASGNVQGYWFGGPVGNAGTTGGPNQAHAHGIAADGNHSHNITVAGVGDHAHAISYDGQHQHNLLVVFPQHTHTFTTAAAGSHQHTFTSDATGGGAAMNVTGPFILMTLYMVL